MVLTRIHVNQHVIKSNRKDGTNEDVLTVKDYKQNRKSNEVAILDDDGREVARVVYRPEAPLKCGAVCWIETNSGVKVL